MRQKTFSFPQMVSRTSHKTKLSENTKSINECLGILLRTRPGELLGDPAWGCNLIERVFMYEGVIVEQLIKEDIITAVNKYEPRIVMTTRDIEIVFTEKAIQIYLQYTIKENGEINTYNMEITPDDNPYK